MWNCHSWPLDATTWGGVDLPLDLPIWHLIVEMWNCHSWPLDASTICHLGEISYHHTWALPLGSRSATWSANMTSNSRNVKLPFLTTRCHYWGVDLPLDLQIWHLIWHSSNASEGKCANWPLTVEILHHTTRCHYQGVDLPLDLPIWPLTVEMWNCHSWPLDATTGGWTCQ